MTEPAGTRVFVYGTLKRGFSNHHFLRGQTFLGMATTVPGYRLFSLGDYPGLVHWEGDAQSVQGEVWQVDDACLADLDVLEGVSEGLYHRLRVRLCPPFDQQVVLSYVYALSVDGRSDLGSEWIG